MKKSMSVQKILVLQSAVFVYSFGSVLSKVASAKITEDGLFSFSFISLITLMLIILMGYALVWQKLLKTTELTVAYANKGMALFWSLMWSMVLFSEQITINNIIGVTLIIVGILVVTGND